MNHESGIMKYGKAVIHDSYFIIHCERVTIEGASPSFMDLALSWDLFIVVFLSTVMAYSFIIGKTESVKMTVATYVAIVATQSIGNVLYRVTGESQAVLDVMGLTMNVGVLSIMKIILFICFIIFLTVKSGIDISYNRDSGSLMTIVYTGLFGASTACLIVSTVFVYAAGGSLLAGTIQLPNIPAEVLVKNPLMTILIANQDVWFALPALLLVGVGFLKNKG